MKHSDSTPDFQDTVPKHSKFIKKWIVISVVGMVFVLLALAALGEILSLHGPYCASIDPTGCTVPVIIVNDTAAALKIKSCISTNGPACGSFDTMKVLQPNDSYRTLGRDDKDPPQAWLVTSTSGKVEGCVNLQFTNDVPTPVTVSLSKLISCNQYL